jgi:hypothetical protein
MLDHTVTFVWLIMHGHVRTYVYENGHPTDQYSCHMALINNKSCTSSMKKRILLPIFHILTASMIFLQCYLTKSMQDFTCVSYLI